MTERCGLRWLVPFAAAAAAGFAAGLVWVGARAAWIMRGWR